MSLCLWLSRLLSSEFESSGAPWQVRIHSQSPSHLARRFDTLPDTEVDNGEDQHDAEGELPAEPPQVLKSLRPMDLQDVAPGVSEKERPVRCPERRADPAGAKGRTGQGAARTRARHQASERAGPAHPGGQSGTFGPQPLGRALSPRGRLSGPSFPGWGSFCLCG